MRLQGCAFIFVATLAGLLHCTPASAGDGGDLLLALIQKHGGEVSPNQICKCQALFIIVVQK